MFVLSYLDEIIEKLKKASSADEKIFALGDVRQNFTAKTSLEELILKSIVVIGQEHIFLEVSQEKILEQLLPVEEFYSEFGGIVGYHSLMLSLLNGEKKEEKSQYFLPQGVSIEDSSLVQKEILAGIQFLPQMAEIYPLGGAADRLRSSLPAACLPFLGKTLLQILLEDVRAREQLYEKLFHKKIVTPIAIMTSQEKNNHAEVVSLFERNNWFGRPKESIRFFCQPSVPAMNKEGKWLCQKEGELLLRPGGHGVIWKLAKNGGIFEWFYSLGRKKALVRQINNPIAGVDHGLLAFTGIGASKDKAFGFAACPRRTKAMEGINVVIEKEGKKVLTNIEYCDFKKYGISEQAEYPCNTNILFADLKQVEKALEKCPVPGMLVNLKKSNWTDKNNEVREEEIVRLESTMQNIADHIEDAFLTQNHRHKTISTAKREFVLGSSLLETPEGCFLDILKNGKELLTLCGVKTSDLDSFIFLYRPSLGPLYSLIAQKIRGGALNGELQLELSELSWENSSVSGSLLIEGGTVHLKNVLVKNQGIDFDAPNIFWKNEIHRKEACIIKVDPEGEFIAENVEILGSQTFEVGPGERLILTSEGSIKELIATPSWKWDYELQEDKIVLNRRKNGATRCSFSCS